MFDHLVKNHDFIWFVSMMIEKLMNSYGFPSLLIMQDFYRHQEVGPQTCRSLVTSVSLCEARSCPLASTEGHAGSARVAAAVEILHDQRR